MAKIAGIFDKLAESTKSEKENENEQSIKRQKFQIEELEKEVAYLKNFNESLKEDKEFLRHEIRQKQRSTKITLYNSI